LVDKLLAFVSGAMLTCDGICTLSCRSVIMSRPRDHGCGNNHNPCHHNNSGINNNNNNQDNVMVEDGEHEDPWRVVVVEESRQTLELRVAVAAAMCVIDAINRDIMRMPV
jgi:hypothetical protein